MPKQPGWGPGLRPPRACRLAPGHCACLPSLRPPSGSPRPPRGAPASSMEVRILPVSCASSGAAPLARGQCPWPPVGKLAIKRPWGCLGIPVQRLALARDPLWGSSQIDSAAFCQPRQLAQRTCDPRQPRESAALGLPPACQHGSHWQASPCHTAISTRKAAHSR
jgi:hypothetical protein